MTEQERDDRIEELMTNKEEWLREAAEDYEIWGEKQYVLQQVHLERMNPWQVKMELWDHLCERRREKVLEHYRHELDEMSDEELLALPDEFLEWLRKTRGLLSDDEVEARGWTREQYRAHRDKVYEQHSAEVEARMAEYCDRVQERLAEKDSGPQGPGAAPV
jgi:hypothetical protein